MDPIVVFIINDQQFAVPVQQVERIVQAVEISCLPNLSAKLLGIINMQGEIIPVIDIRRCMAIPAREIKLSDKLVIIKFSQNQLLAFLVDKIVAVIDDYSQQYALEQSVFSKLNYNETVVKANGSLIVMLPDLEKCFDPEEKTLLKKAADNDRKG